MLLFEEEITPYVPIMAPDEDEEVKEKEKPRRVKPSEKMNLPEIRQEHTLDKDDQTCDECQSDLKKFAEDVSEEIVYVSAKVILKKHARFKYVCPECEGNIKSAPKPLQIIPKSNAGVSLLTKIIMSKYADHLPLHRQCTMFARFGAEFARSTLSGWMMRCADLLEPIAEYMLSEILESHALHTDDTRVPVMAKGKTREGRLWVYLGDDSHPYIYFHYSPNRKAEWTRNILENYSGYVHADAYPGYDKIFKEGRRNRDGERIDPAKEVGCNAHARRKFEEIYDHDPPLIEKALVYYKKLYKIERRIKVYDAAKRKKIRRKESKPVHEDFYRWITSLKDQSLPASLLGAVNYALNHKAALMAYLEDGQLSIDNNPAERALRCVAVGRNNWKFVGNDRGGKAAAIFYSLIETCKLHDVNPYAYLHDSLIAMADCRDRGEPDTMKTFTPLHWKRTRTSVEKEFQEKS